MPLAIHSHAPRFRFQPVQSYKSPKGLSRQNGLAFSDLGLFPKTLEGYPPSRFSAFSITLAGCCGRRSASLENLLWTKEHSSLETCVRNLGLPTPTFIFCGGSNALSFLWKNCKKIRRKRCDCSLCLQHKILCL